jgi:uncharacterized membrane protein YfcA
MSAPLVYFLAGLVIFISHLVAGVTGFGNQIVALPLLALLVGLDAGKTTLVVLGTVMYTILTVRWHERVNVRKLVPIVLVTGVGLVLGILLYEKLPERWSKLALGVFVTVMGLQGLFRPGLLKHVPDSVAKVMLLAGGIVHGAFTTGGPLLVIYCQRALPHKSEFRSTLGVMWIALNVGLMAGWALAGWPEPGKTWRLVLVGLPFVLAGLYVGDYLHHRLDGPAFRAVVNGVLVVNGLLLVLSSI